MVVLLVCEVVYPCSLNRRGFVQLTIGSMYCCVSVYKYRLKEQMSLTVSVNDE